jgi:hypothetical protein
MGSSWIRADIQQGEHVRWMQKTAIELSSDRARFHELCLCIRVHIYWIFLAFSNIDKVKPVNRRCRKVAAENAEI